MSEEDLTNNKTYISDFDITKHIVLDNESNYWYSAEYVDKMLKKQDKEIERLNKRIEDLNTINEEHQMLNGMIRKELQQKENIIKEVREYVEEMQIWLVDFEDFGITTKGLLEILDKENKNE